MARPIINEKQAWQRPLTHFYEDNYRFGINFYQPMVDYLDAKKESRKSAREYPHLPWNNERGLYDYGSRKGVKSYSEEDLRHLAEEAEEQARRNLSSFKVARRSDFSLCKSVSAAALSKHIAAVSKTERGATEVTKKKKRQEKRVKMADMSETETELMLQKALHSAHTVHVTRSAKAIEGALMLESMKNLSGNTAMDIKAFQRQQKASVSASAVHDIREHSRIMEAHKHVTEDVDQIVQPLDKLRVELKDFDKKTTNYLEEKSKQTSIEIEQLNARVVEAETKLKTEVTRIKKKFQIIITDLEMSLDVANKNNIELQKTVKKQSLSLTELQAHYEEIQRQLAVTMDQFGIAQRRLQSLTAENEEVRQNYEQALRQKRVVEQQVEEYQTRINELTTINVNISSAKIKLEQELTTLAGDYDEVTRELRVSDERYQRVQVELKHTVESLHEEQERIVKIEAIKKSLEIEVKNLTIRLEEVEANAIVGGRRIITKLEARLRDLELELDEEKRRHAETLKILRKKERSVKEVMIQVEEDQKNISLLQEQVDKSNQKMNIYKRQLQEQEGMSQQSVTRVRRFQRELEAAEDRAESAESNLSLVRAKHRTFVTTSTVPGSQVYLVQETHRQQTTTSTSEY